MNTRPYLEYHVQDWFKDIMDRCSSEMPYNIIIQNVRLPYDRMLDKLGLYLLEFRSGKDNLIEKRILSSHVKVAVVRI